MVMTYMLAPYNDAMRLGMGFNTFTQSLCIDGAVKPDPKSIVTTHGGGGGGGDGGPETAGGPSQAVTYSSRVVEKLSEVVDTLNVSYSAAIKRGTVEVSGDATTIDEDKIKTSDLNAIVSVKVQNQTTIVSESSAFQSMSGVLPNSKRFNEIYGDSYISGFIEGGEFTGVVSIRILESERLKKDQVSSQIKKSLGKGPESDDFALDSFNISNSSSKSTREAVKNTETTVSVHWIGGGQVKDAAKLWDIDTMFEAAAAFPSHVAACPQRTWAIITKYSSNKSYVQWEQTCDAIYAPLEYGSIITYSQELFEDYFEYKQLVKLVQNIINEPENYEGESLSESSVPLPQKAFLEVLDVHADNVYAVRNVAEPMPLDLSTLLAVRQAMFNEMTKIVEAVDVLSKDPGMIKRNPDKLQPTNNFVKNVLATALAAKTGKSLTEPQVRSMISPIMAETVLEQDQHTDSKSSSSGNGFVTLSPLAAGAAGDAGTPIASSGPKALDPNDPAPNLPGQDGPKTPDPKAPAPDASVTDGATKPVFKGPAVQLNFDLDSLITPDVWNQLLPLPKKPTASPGQGGDPSKPDVPPLPDAEKRLVTADDYRKLKADSAQLAIVTAERDKYKLLFTDISTWPLYPPELPLSQNLRATVDRNKATKSGSYLLSQIFGDPEMARSNLTAFNDVDYLDDTWIPTKITISYQESPGYLTGVATVYSNGKTVAHGPRSGTSRTIDFSATDSNGKRGKAVFIQMKAANTGNWAFPIVNYVCIGTSLARSLFVEPKGRISQDELTQILGPPAPGMAIKGFWGETGDAVDRLGVVWGKV